MLHLLKLVRNHRGISLVSTLIGLGVVSVALLATTDMFKVATFSSSYLAQRLEQVDVYEEVVRTLSTEATCSCQLDKNLNTARATALSFNTLASPLVNINLQILRANCTFAATDNIVIQQGQRTSPGNGGLLVQSVQIKNIKQIDTNVFSGVFTVDFSTENKKVALNKLEHRIAFEIDPNSGTATNRRISKCVIGRSIAGPMECPTGFTMIGNPGNVQTFCIHTNEQPPLYEPVADGYCGALITDKYWSKVCNTNDLVAACHLGAGLKDMTDDWELNDGYGPGYVALNGSCDARGFDTQYLHRPFRCCLRAK